ncbi:MAG TPA: hypothetical protein GXZ59_05425, partial [Clostridiaceae bacterium]|nr:hypothetical protein [Clostridiaceae bacterium]
MHNVKSTGQSDIFKSNRDNAISLSSSSSQRNKREDMQIRKGGKRSRSSGIGIIRILTLVSVLAAIA